MGIFLSNRWCPDRRTVDTLIGEVVERLRVTVTRKGARCVPSLLFSSITLGSSESRVIFFIIESHGLKVPLLPSGHVSQ